MSDYPRPRGATTEARCPHGTEAGTDCPDCNAEISAGMNPLRWEPETLPRSVLERVLVDALADLYGDSFRRGESHRDRNVRFMADLKRCVMAATGVDLVSMPRGSRREVRP